MHSKAENAPDEIKLSKDFFKDKVICPYKDKCSSYPDRCDRCKNNKNNKKDYYEPDWDPFVPNRPKFYCGW